MNTEKLNSLFHSLATQGLTRLNSRAQISSFQEIQKLQDKFWATFDIKTRTIMNDRKYGSIRESCFKLIRKRHETYSGVVISRFIYLTHRFIDREQPHQ